jgi:hypothetical protein
MNRLPLPVYRSKGFLPTKSSRGHGLIVKPGDNASTDHEIAHSPRPRIWMDPTLVASHVNVLGPTLLLRGSIKVGEIGTWFS